MTRVCPIRPVSPAAGTPPRPAPHPTPPHSTPPHPRPPFYADDRSRNVLSRYSRYHTIDTRAQIHHHTCQPKNISSTHMRPFVHLHRCTALRAPFARADVLLPLSLPLPLPSIVPINFRLRLCLNSARVRKSSMSSNLPRSRLFRRRSARPFGEKNPHRFVGMCIFVCESLCKLPGDLVPVAFRA